jgi:hypothetical protein
MLKLEITVNFDLNSLIWQDFLIFLCFRALPMGRIIAKIRHFLPDRATARLFKRCAMPGWVCF